MTAEQVFNHLLPAIAGIKPNIILKVVHDELVKNLHTPGVYRHEKIKIIPI